MCQICTAFESKEISGEEAVNMLGRANLDAAHMFEVIDLVMATEVPMIDRDPEMDAIYEKELKG